MFLKKDLQWQFELKELSNLEHCSIFIIII